MSQHGRKFDQDKPDFSLVPPHALEEVAKVLTFGASKYEPDNWKFVPNASRRYIAAAMRHINEYLKNEIYDDETSLHHLAHAICCLMFIVDIEEVGGYATVLELTGQAAEEYEEWLDAKTRSKEEGR